MWSRGAETDLSSARANKEADQVNMAFKQKKRANNTKNKHLKPGALAQLCHKNVTSRSCPDICKKKEVLVTKKRRTDILRQSELVDHAPLILTPKKTILVSALGGFNETNQYQLSVTPKTPKEVEWIFQSGLESLPMDILVKVLCHLHHNQLRAVFHVSKRIRKAVLLARQYHFNYMTPNQSPHEMLRTKTSLPMDHWPFMSKAEGNHLFGSSPITPKAPKHGRRPPRPRAINVNRVSTVLFQEHRKFSRFAFPLGSLKPISKSLASNRVLFFDDEPCQAVVQTKLP